MVVIPSGAIVTPKGGMNGESFEKWLDTCIYPLFPDISPGWVYDSEGELVGGPVVLKIDGGPGRLGPASHVWRKRAAARGLFTFPGLQNATSVNQEMDDLYGTFQQTCDDVNNDIVAERVAKRAHEDEEGTLPHNKRTKVQLTNCDLGRIVCGRAEDPIEARAFERAFTPEKVLSAFAKVGAVPLTRAGLDQKKVRHEDTEGDPGADVLRELAAQHAANKAAVAVHGMDATVFSAALPRRQLIERPTGEAAQFASLVESGVTHTSVWHTMGSAAHNCDTILAAEAARMLGERAAAEATEAEQQSSLRLLQEQAIAAETERDHESKEYEDLGLSALKMIVKCLFQLNGKTGFSKLGRKADLVKYLDEYGEDVHEALSAPLPTPGVLAAVAEAETAADAAAAAAAAAATNDTTTEDTARADANAESVEEVDRQLTALLARRRIAVAAADRAAARLTVAAPAATAAAAQGA